MSSIQIQNLFSVDGLVAVVTGGGTGIGLMMAKALALKGAAKVYIIGRRKDVLEEAAKQSQHNNIIPIVGDVTSQESLSSVVDQIKSEVGYVNVVVANAGTPGPRTNPIKADSSISKIREQLWGASIEDFTHTFDVNVSSVLYTFAAFLELLDAGNQKKNIVQKSQFIATTSVSAYNRAPMGSMAYGPSKAATTQLMKALSTNMAPHGIRANVISPGLFQTDLTQAAFKGKDGSKEGSFPHDSIPLTRAGVEDDIAGTLIYLASRAGAYCNGCIIVLDGGRVGIFPSSY